MKCLKISIPIISTLMIFQALIILLSRPVSVKSKLFREYIGAEFLNVTFSDLPINSKVEFHFILSFAIDYTTDDSNPSPTNGKFNKFWDTDNLTPTQALAIKDKHPNVKLAVSLGGDSIGNGSAYFDPKDEDSWVSNAVSSLTTIINENHLSGIDIDYEHFRSRPKTFANCIGKLIKKLKENGTISFASIAPFDDPDVQKYYLALWKKYSDQFDYVNFQFYAYENTTTVSQFIDYFETQTKLYKGGKVLTSFISDGSLGLSPRNGFFKACKKLKQQGKLNGIFVWCADESKALGFKYEKKSQHLLAK